ncbi:hypothetical protein K7432_000085 [Basidiobolus ranarum]|uniref:Ribosome biogenesis protein SLX9 n=1 Tax=Basidiobolus ranarum TaxID=34480 RepID=A0ABR2WBT5_9FUNG
MPKVRRNRTRLHNQAVGTPHVSERTFAAHENQVQKLADTVETVNSDGLNSSKKEKRKQRHENWLSKLHTAHQELKKNRKKDTSLNMTMFKEVLPNIEADKQNKDQNKLSQENMSKKRVATKKGRKNTALQEIVRFQNILKHPNFRQNPLQTIQQHVANTVETRPTVEEQDS